MDFTRADYESDLEEYFGRKVEKYIPPAEDEFSLEQFLEMMDDKFGAKMDISVARTMLNEGVDDGRLSCRPHQSGVGRPTTLYRWVKND